MLRSAHSMATTRLLFDLMVWETPCCRAAGRQCADQQGRVCAGQRGSAFPTPAAAAAGGQACGALAASSGPTEEGLLTWKVTGMPAARKAIERVDRILTSILIPAA